MRFRELRVELLRAVDLLPRMFHPLGLGRLLEHRHHGVGVGKLGVSQGEVRVRFNRLLIKPDGVPHHLRRIAHALVEVVDALQIKLVGDRVGRVTLRQLRFLRGIKLQAQA